MSQTQEPELDENGWPSMVDPDDLSDFAGSPFPPSLVLAASSSIRSEAEWHIAPEITETIELNSRGGSLLMLPTMRLGSVVSVVDTSNDTPVPIEDWRMTKSGMLYRRSGWPRGFATVSATITHGYPKCPAALWSVLADRAGAAARNVAVTQESAGTQSISYSSAAEYLASLNESPVVARFKIQDKP